MGSAILACPDVGKVLDLVQRYSAIVLPGIRINRHSLGAEVAVDFEISAVWGELDRMLVETDAPFLAPVPHRGKTNQPAYVAHVGRALAQIKGLTDEEVSQATTGNFEQLFGVSVKACD